MDKNESVEHSGIVESVENEIVRVGFVSQASCSSCHARGACSISEIDNKFVEVKSAEPIWKIGEQVTIVLQQSLGFKALWFGYLIPLLVLVVTVVIVSALTGKDGLAGLLAIGMLIPYYSILYFYRKELKNKFDFTLKKSNNQ